MKSHPYLRAYMAGIAFPTPFLLVAFAGFIIGRYVVNVPIPIERIVVFPLALIPNLWGIWNVLYVFLAGRGRLPIGLHGAILPFVIAPGLYYLARALDVVTFPLAGLAIGFPIAVALYYLIWKYAVGSLNRVMGLA